MKDYDFKGKIKLVAQLGRYSYESKEFFEATGRCYAPGDTDTQKGKPGFADQMASHLKTKQKSHIQSVQMSKYVTYPKCKMPSFIFSVISLYDCVASKGKVGRKL